MIADPAVCVQCGDTFDAEEALCWKWRQDCCSQRCSDQEDAERKATCGEMNDDDCRLPYRHQGDCAQ